MVDKLVIIRLFILLCQEIYPLSYSRKMLAWFEHSEGKGMCQDKSFRMYGNFVRIIDWKRRGEENDVKVLTLRTLQISRAAFCVG